MKNPSGMSNSWPFWENSKPKSEKWKTSYVHSYRKAHRAYYEKLSQLETGVDALKPKARALVKMNTIVELGPPLPTMSSVATDLAAVEKRIYVCPDAAQAAVEG